LDGEIHRPTATKLFRIWPIEEGDAEVELGRGVDYAIACHTTLLSLNSRLDGEPTYSLISHLSVQETT